MYLPEKRSEMRSIPTEKVRGADAHGTTVEVISSLCPANSDMNGAGD
jgi:hypothetical protein